jgi:ribosome-binding factor A
MGTIRQNKIENVIQEAISEVLMRNPREICLGAMVTPTVVRITPDLSLARVFVSIFAGPPKEEVLANINQNKGKIKREVGIRLKSMRKMPEIEFKIDDSLDYAEKIDELLKK